MSNVDLGFKELTQAQIDSVAVDKVGIVGTIKSTGNEPWPALYNPNTPHYRAVWVFADNRKKRQLVLQGLTKRGENMVIAGRIKHFESKGFTAMEARIYGKYSLTVSNSMEDRVIDAVLKLLRGNAQPDVFFKSKERESEEAVIAYVEEHTESKLSYQRAFKALTIASFISYRCKVITKREAAHA